eukprot:6268542-Alexandrium_andersonii.AAC.1
MVSCASAPSPSRAKRIWPPGQKPWRRAAARRWSTGTAVSRAIAVGAVMRHGCPSCRNLGAAQSMSARRPISVSSAETSMAESMRREKSTPRHPSRGVRRRLRSHTEPT